MAYCKDDARQNANGEMTNTLIKSKMCVIELRSCTYDDAYACAARLPLAQVNTSYTS